MIFLVVGRAFGMHRNKGAEKIRIQNPVNKKLILICSNVFVFKLIKGSSGTKNKA